MCFRNTVHQTGRQEWPGVSKKPWTRSPGDAAKGRVGDKAAPETKEQVGKAEPGASLEGAILQPGCPSEPPGQHFKYPGARRRTWNRCPQGTFSKASCIPQRKLGFFIHILIFSLSFCLCVFGLCLTHTHTHTCTRLALSHSKQQRARLHLAAAPCSSCIRAGAQQHGGTRRRPASTPTLSPPLIP